MRKLWFIVVILITSFLTACNDQELIQKPSITQPNVDTIVDQTPVPTVEDVEETVLPGTLESLTVTEGFEFELFAIESIPIIKNKYFLIEFKEISYNPVKNEICLVFTYNDPEYVHAKYYMIGREKGTYLTSQQLSYSISKPTGTHGGCFNFMNKEATYEILIGKIDSDDLNPTSYMEAVGSIEFIDKNYNERKKIGRSILAINPSIDYTYDQVPSITLDINIEDVHQIIDTVILQLYDEENDTFEESFTLESSEMSWSEGILSVKDYQIDGLAPYLDYRIKMYISGYNGFEEFEGILVQTRDFKSQNVTDSVGFRRHGFFAEIVNVDVDGTTATLSYVAVNNQSWVSSTDNNPYQFMLRIYDSMDVMRLEKTIDVTKNSTTIPIAYAQIGNRLEIVTDRDDLLIYETTVQPPMPKVELSYIKGSGLYGFITDGVGQVNYILAIVYSSPDENSLDQGEASWFPSTGAFRVALDNYTSFQDLDNVLVFYQISYQTTEGTKFFSRYVWVENQG